MIGYLRGRIQDVTAESILLDVQGVGYEVLAPSALLDECQFQRGELRELWISTHVREDAFQLFGFQSVADKQFFLTLLKVNGVGPKLALNVMSGASVAEITSLIESEDVKGLSKLPKVGKKTAEQMILTLKGKLVIHQPELRGEAPVATAASLEISSALVHLGFRSVDVDKVVSKFPKDITFEEGVRQGLASLTSL